MAVRLAQVKKHKSKTETQLVYIYVKYAGTKALDSSYVIWFPIKSVKEV